MRKLLTILTITTLLFGSCKKSETPENPRSQNQEVSSSKLAALQLMDLEERKVAYKLLNESEKSSYWKLIVSNFLSENSSLGTEGVNLISDLQLHIRPEIFRPHSDDNSFFKDYYVIQWLAKAEKLFNSTSIAELAYKPGLKAQTKDNNLKTSPDVSTSCACNLGSRFDCVKSTVHIGTDGISYTETHGACVNSSSGCSTSAVGCGFFWLYSCNGSSCVF